MMLSGLPNFAMAIGYTNSSWTLTVDMLCQYWCRVLSYMDANGYTGIGVVSPQSGVEVGQPEILAEAKRGVIDADVVGDATRKTVAALLDEPDRRRRYAEAGRDRFRSMFLAEHATARLVDLLDEVAGLGPERSAQPRVR